MKTSHIFSLVQTIILVVIAINLIFRNDGPFFKPNYSIVQQARESELKYFNYLSELTDEVQTYITKMSPSSNLRALELIELCNQYDVDVKFALAQGFIESHFGVFGLAAKTNSVWNVGAFDGLSSDGVHKKYRYEHPNESIEPYLKLLRDRYLVDKTESNLMTDFVDVNGHRYASAPDYESRLRTVYDSIAKETRIDELQSMLRHYKIECGR